MKTPMEGATQTQTEIEIEIPTPTPTNAQHNDCETLMGPDAEAPCNQETETAAMTADRSPKTPTKPTTTNTTTTTPTPTPTTTTTIARSTTTAPIIPTTTSAANGDAAPATPALFATPQPPASQSAQGGNTGPSHGTGTGTGTSTSNSGSMKKKRSRNVVRRIDLEATKPGGVGVGAGGGEVDVDVGSIGQSSIKTSLSMTSLPPDEQHEGRDVIRAKLRVERPYNSLKKNADRGIMQLSCHGNICSTPGTTAGSNSNKHHRYSWGSSGGHSHSSSSLHSSAATLGKDDLWAAIQTNYNYIMDTNLLDTCKEARCEIEGAASTMENPIDCCFKMLDETQRSEGACEDPRELRRWLRDMEGKLDAAPSLSEATLFSIAELQRHLADHSVLYHEIVSHARVVSACIRAASERGHQQQQLQQQHSGSNNTSIAEQNNSSLSSTDESSPQQHRQGEGKSSSSSSTTTSTSTSSAAPATATASATPTATSSSTTTSKKSEGNLERLQNRYHLLYLKAFEVQLWLDGLLRKKTSTASVLNGDDEDDSDDDSSDCEAGGATEDDLEDVASDLGSDATRNSSSYCELQRCHIERVCIADRDNDDDNDEDEEIEEEEDVRDHAPTGRQLLVLHRDCIENKADCSDGDDEEEEDDEDEDEVDCGDVRYSAVVVTAGGGAFDKSGSLGPQPATTTLTDFEADSESSDFETLNSLRRRKPADFRCGPAKVPPPTTASTPSSLATNGSTTGSSTANTNNTPLAPAASLATNHVAAHPAAMSTQQQQQQQQKQLRGIENFPKSTTAASQALDTTMSATCTAATQTQVLQQQQQQQAPRTPSKAKSIAIISPTCHGNNKGQQQQQQQQGHSPTALRKRPQRHAVDISKFNRSNRKSKNCAIFYFKHLDTDNETNYADGHSNDGNNDSHGNSQGEADALSSAASHTSELIKSADATSDDDDDEDGWLYSASPAAAAAAAAAAATVNGLSADGVQSSAVSSTTTTAVAATGASGVGDDSDKENKEAIATSCGSVPVSGSTQVAVVEVQLAASGATTATATAIAANGGHLAISSSSSCSQSSDGSCSSNDLLTETTTSATTTATAQMHLYRAEMDVQLQINGHHHHHHNGNNINTNTISNNNNNSGNSGSNEHNNMNMNININGAKSRNNQQSDMRNAQQQQQSLVADSNGNSVEGRGATTESMGGTSCYYTRADICNIVVKPGDLPPPAPNPQLLSPGRRLPPRSPAKSIRSNMSNGTMSTMSPPKEISHESIKQLVLEAEHLVRDEALKTPTKPKHALVKISSTIKKREVIMPGPIKQRVQEWLEHQPTTPMQLSKSHEPLSSASASSTRNGNGNGDDCEASGEASETDSIPQPGSDTSEGFTDSIATCMQTSTNSFGNSTELIGGSAEPIVGPVLGYGSSNQSLNVSGVVKIVKRQQTRRKAERPWSVSCLSQLTTESAQVVTKAVAASNVQAGLASHSISESALDSLSPGRPRASSTSVAHVKPHVKAYDSKGSLKRRKTRKKKHSGGGGVGGGFAAAHSAGRKTTTDSGSEETAEMPKLSQTLLMKSCEAMSAHRLQEITQALLNLQKPSAEGAVAAQATSLPSQQQQQQQQLQPQQAQQAQPESGEEEPHLMKPNFRVGSYTTAYMTSEARLGSLAALATYMNDEEQQGEYTTGTEDHHSSFSETAWDNYQEKYNSENYSEGFDSDAARRLMEFGDDYRNFIDSQSDCCSSLSAANNLDSLSPPRMDSLQHNEAKIISQETIVSSVDHARRRRALELEYERRRKTLEVRRKSCQDSSDNQQPHPRSPTISLSSSANALTPKNSEAAGFQFRHSDSASRKLEFGMSHSTQSLRRTSESDTSTRRRKADERRRSSRNLEKCIKLIPATTSSSSGDDTDDEKEMRNLLTQSRHRLEDTRSLKIRCHLLRPEDYAEIINTCRDNIRCLEAVLRGPPGTVLSAPCATQTKDLLAAWEDLLGWSENAAAARKMQEEMIVLKHTLNRLGSKSSLELLDTEPSIQIAIEALKNEKSQLQTYRTNMLRLNASVHSWLTRQERKLQLAVAEQQLKEASAKASAVVEAAGAETQHDQQVQLEQQQQQQQQKAAATITVTDSNGNQVEAHAVGVSAAMMSTGTSTEAVEAAQLETLVHSESEFHKHLKDEVSDMYSAWDEADARINNQLEVLTTSLIAWRQLECGLSEFQQVLGKDRGTLKGLEGALDKGHATPVELAQNVKLVAKLLSEKVNVSQEQLTAVQEHLDPNHILHIAKFTASNGSLSDSGISDGGTTSDGGLSERERRLGVLRRLAKQLESALAPGSEAMKSIAARMESAEAELKNLQNTCRDLIVRTAATHQNKKQLEAQRQQLDGGHGRPANGKSNGSLSANGGGTQNSQSHSEQQQGTKQRRNKQRKERKHSGSSAHSGHDEVASHQKSTAKSSALAAGAPDGGSGDPDDDPALEFEMTSSDDKVAKPHKNGWAWRIAKAALPMQIALFTFLCAACLMQPNCCDNLNNLSMSFTPQLRYIRGPPPI